MQNNSFCQSCSLPLTNPELLGTEKDGSKSKEYCKYCYQEGLFTHPHMTLEEMRSSVISKMEKIKLPTDIIESSVNRLSHLKRWTAYEIQHQL